MRLLIPVVVVGALAASCSCDPGPRGCGTCPQGTVCLDGGCQAGCNNDLDCSPGLACVGQKCLKLACLNDVDCGPGLVCMNHVCAVTDAGTTDAGGPGADAGGDGGADAGSDGGVDGGPVDAGPCQPSCGPANCGASDHCGGTCPACCYQCQAIANACGYDVQLADAGLCPVGYDAGQPPCAPCWSCGASDAYCVTPSCCGTYTIDGMFAAGTCNCFGCNEHGYAQDVYDACVNAQNNTLASSTGGVCIWPSGQNTSPCGFEGSSGSPFWFDGGTPGGCSCRLSCGGSASTCCVAKNSPVSSAAQCCSGQVGACPGTGNNCCQ